ncbi:MAG TPA: hypothetical protein VF520_00790 [Thermoleophilaceae bacterium]
MPAAVLAAFALAAPANAQDDSGTALAPKAPATIDGSCKFDGTANFELPIRVYPQDMDWRFRATGTCSGVVNGKTVVNTPAEWAIDAHGPVSCTYGYTNDARFQITFLDTAGDRKLTGDLYLVQTVLNNLFLKGDAGGTAEGQSTFFQNTYAVPDCIDGNTIYSLQATNTFAMHGPLSG